MNIYIPFTYIIGWSKHKKFYYGAKYAQGCQPSDLWTTYFTSSKLVEDYRKRFGEPDIIKIHKTFSDKDSCVLFESSYLEKIDAKNQSIFLNQSNGGGGDFYKKKVTEKEKEKTKKTHLEKYGYESSNSAPEVKEKKKQSYLEKYGVEYNFQLKDFSEKSKQTCLEKYGYESSNSAPEVKEKKKQTCLEKYGVENYTKTEGFKEKTKQTCLEKYGVEYSLQSEEVREKGKETCLEKYGYESSNSSPEVKERKKQSYLERYGSENPSQVAEFQEKKKKTFLIKFGVDHQSKIKKNCCYCGEMKSVTHESKCKKNPDRKVPNKTGKDNPLTKRYNVTSPNGEEYIIISRTNLIEFAKQKNLKHYSLMGNKIEGWSVTEIEKLKET